MVHEELVTSHHMVVKRGSKSLVNGLRERAADAPKKAFVDGSAADIICTNASYRVITW